MRAAEIVDVQLWGYDSTLGGVGSASDWQLVPLDHLDGGVPAATTVGAYPYVDTDDGDGSYVLSKFPWNTAVILGAGTAGAEVTVRASLQVPSFGFINSHVYLFDTANAPAGIDGALLDLFLFVEGPAGSWVQADLVGDGPAVADALSGGRLAAAFMPDLAVSWVSVELGAKPIPLRQRQRDDGLGMSTARARGGSSRQASIRQRGYF